MGILGEMFADLLWWGLQVSGEGAGQALGAYGLHTRTGSEQTGDQGVDTRGRLPQPLPGLRANDSPGRPAPLSCRHHPEGGAKRLPPKPKPWRPGDRSGPPWVRPAAQGRKGRNPHSEGQEEHLLVSTPVLRRGIKQSPLEGRTANGPSRRSVVQIHPPQWPWKPRGRR